MKVYISGPMSGVPQFNYPAFNAMAAELRKVVTGPGEHIEVFNPAEAASPDVQAKAMASANGMGDEGYPTQGEFIGQAVRTIINGGFDALVMLDGWETSRGARCEAVAGVVSGCKIVKIERFYGNRISLYEMTRSELLAGLEGVSRGWKH